MRISKWLDAPRADALNPKVEALIVLGVVTAAAAMIVALCAVTMTCVRPVGIAVYVVPPEPIPATATTYEPAVVVVSAATGSAVAEEVMLVNVGVPNGVLVLVPE
jgi:hypothetical protein